LLLFHTEQSLHHDMQKFTGSAEQITSHSSSSYCCFIFLVGINRQNKHACIEQVEWIHQ
jgi:hypothetical protein